MATEESSVMMAIGELRRLEEERIAERRRAEERSARERAEAEARERAAREAAEHEARERIRCEAEAAARARADAELARDRSLEELRARIAAVQAERDLVREALRARASAEAAPSSRPGPWALAFGLSSVVAAALACVLVIGQQAPLAARAEPPSAAAIATHGGAREGGAGALATASETVERAVESDATEVAPEAQPIAAADRAATGRGHGARGDRGARERGHARGDHGREDGADRERGADLSSALGLEGEDDGDEVLSDRFLRDATRRR